MGLEDQKPKRDIRFPLRVRGIRIEKTNNDEFPDEVDFTGLEGLSESKKELVRQLIVPACKAYYNGILMSDRYGLKHDDRRNMRNILMKVHGDDYMIPHSANKLRLNRITTAYVPLLRLRDALNAQDIHTPQADRLREVIEKLPSGVDIVGADIPMRQRLRYSTVRAERIKQGMKFTSTDKLGVLYHGMNDEQKIKLTEQMDAVIDKVLDILVPGRTKPQTHLRDGT